MTIRILPPVTPLKTAEVVRPPVAGIRPAAPAASDVFDPVVRRLNFSAGDRQVELSGLLEVKTPKSKEEALAAIDQVLIGGEVGEDPDGVGGQGTVGTDPEDVNAPTGGLDEVRAAKLVEANAELEAAELEKLSPQERAQYQSVMSELEQQDDPKAQLALQKLLFEGKLPGAEDAQGGGTLLENLAGLANPCGVPLAEGVDRRELLADVVREVAVPSAIAQHQRGTCAATVVGIHLADESPAEYVRLMTGLASPSGEVELANGDVITREEGTIGDDGSGRSLSQRLIEPAFMEYANGADLDYDNASDEHRDEDGNKVHTGLYSSQVDRLLEGVFDHRFENRDGINTEEEREEAWDELVDEVENEGREVEVGVRWGTGGHKLLVTDISQDASGQEFVTYVNPWGKTETLPKEEFLDRLQNMNTEGDDLFSEIGDWIDSAPVPADPLQEQVGFNRRGLIAA